MFGLRYLEPLILITICWQQATLAPQRQLDTSGQQESVIPAGKQVIPGFVEETDEDCPVAVSEVATAIDYDPAREKPLWLVREELRIENRSKRVIKTVMLGTERGLFLGWVLSSFYVTKRLDPGEVRTEVNNLNQQFRRIRPWNGETNFVVWVMGVEYEDGSHWAALRNFKRPLMTRRALNVDKAPLFADKFEWGVGSSYRGTLQASKSGGVVAYRMGVLRDSPDAFEIKLGGLVELRDKPLEVGTNLLFSSDDEGASLPTDDVFTKHRYRITSGAWVEAGVTLFVAEARFVDGTVWKSSLKREDLLWKVH